MTRATRLVALGAVLAFGSAPGGRPTLAQAPAEAPVPLTAEPSHSQVLESALVRVFRVEVAPGASTKLHEHTHDFIWVALGDARIVDHPRDGAERTVEAKDGALTFRPRGVVHAVRNAGEAPFRNVTIELLHPQTGERNQCGDVLPDQALDCPSPDGLAGALRTTPSVLPEFETDQTLVNLLTLPAGGRFGFKPSKNPPVLVALEGTDAEALVDMKIAGGAIGKGSRPLHGGDAMEVPVGMGVELRNLGKSPARFAVLEFRSP